MTVSESFETIKDSFTKTYSHEWEFFSQRSSSDYSLNKMFLEPGELSFYERFKQMFKVDLPKDPPKVLLKREE